MAAIFTFPSVWISHQGPSPSAVNGLACISSGREHEARGTTHCLIDKVRHLPSSIFARLEHCNTMCSCRRHCSQSGFKPPTFAVKSNGTTSPVSHLNLLFCYQQ